MNERALWISGGVAAALLLLYLLQPILAPFAVGALVAYLGDPLVDRLERRGLTRTASVCVVFALFTLLVLLGVGLLLPMLIDQVIAFCRQLPEGVDRLRQHLLPWLAARLQLQQPELLLDQLKLALTSNWREIGGFAGNLVQGVSSSGLALLGFAASLALIPVVAFYLLRDWDRMVLHLRDLLPRKWEGTVVGLVHECDEVLGAFVRGQLMVMLALGGIYAVGLQLVGLELALLLGLLAGLASVVPYLGFAVGVVASCIAALLQYHDWLPLVWVTLVFAIGQFLEGMVLTPRLVGERIGLHPVAVIFAVMAGGQLFGFVGILLALPAAAVAMVLLRHMHRSYKQSGFYGHSQGGAD